MLNAWKNDKCLYKLFVGNPEGKRPRGTLRCRWLESVKIDLREIRWKVLKWVHLAQDRGNWQALVNTVINLQVP
jgi:hypothetical protein